MARFMSEAAEAGFREAIQAIEKVSSAEVVVAVRPRLHRWWIGNAIAGAVVMTAVLAFLLFSEDYEFELWSIAIMPLLAAIAGALLVEAVAPLERLLTPPTVRDAIVREAARATFYELGVHNTKGRTGVLVFVALRERRVMLVGDLAIVERLAEAGLARQAEALAGELGNGGEALAKALAKLAGDYAAVLPCATDDVNELGDLVQVRRTVRRFRGSVR
ncbi:MAG: hypothetical protein ABI867_31530 [Kofleriaceae bacterium]